MEGRAVGGFQDAQNIGDLVAGPSRGWPPPADDDPAADVGGGELDLHAVAHLKKGIAGTALIGLRHSSVAGVTRVPTAHAR